MTRSSTPLVQLVPLPRPELDAALLEEVWRAVAGDTAATAAVPADELGDFWVLQGCGAAKQRSITFSVRRNNRKQLKAARGETKHSNMRFG